MDLKKQTSASKLLVDVCQHTGGVQIRVTKYDKQYGYCPVSILYYIHYYNEGTTASRFIRSHMAQTNNTVQSI